MTLFLAIMVLLALGYGTLVLLFPSALTPNFFVLRLCLGWAIGLGISGVLLITSLLLWPERLVYYPLAETLVAVSLWGVIYLRRKHLVGKIFPSQSPPSLARDKKSLFSLLVQISFWLALLGASLSFLFLFWESPHGKWDAWTIWNLHARFIFRGGANWYSYITPELLWSHPDYPLLLPLAVARVWLYVGTETQVAPALIAGIFGLATT
ncbi:MAG: hypothetical protein K9K75_01915, partial [Deltaproteobacteria bacterium]|nr:hypothetical protein [Deltaproteobacteria bacterium]